MTTTFDDAAPAPATRAERRAATSRPRWEWPAFAALLVATAVLYLWGLGRSGWANSYYSAAVQAGTTGWKAMFFGSFDGANAITVDKSPGALWVMAVSARIFGVNSWSILVPQALEGVAAVAVLYATVRRWYGAPAALLAGAVLATTPAAALMFRYNNPDALLVLLLVIGAYAMTRAVERGNTWWLILAGTTVGFGFLAKMLQALLVLPAFGLVYLIAGPPRLGKRIGQLFLTGVAAIVAAGWWVAIVELWPKSSRPYIGGSTNNSVWNLLIGYNGIGRLSGNETGSVGGAPGQAGRWGPTGFTRLFNADFGGQASWLLPAALILLVAGLVLTATRPRTDRDRAALVLWGAWLVVTGLAFSLSKGIIHSYYTVALGPAIGAIVGIGVVSLWRRADVIARSILAVTLITTAWWAGVLLGRVPDWATWLRPTILVAAIIGAVLILVGPHAPRGVRVLAGACGTVALLLGPTAYSVATAQVAHSGPLPSAGPSGAPSGFGGGRGGPGGMPGGFPGRANGSANGSNRNGFPQFPGNGNGGFPPFGGSNGGNGSNNNAFPQFPGNGNGGSSNGSNGNGVPQFPGNGNGGSSNGSNGNAFPQFPGNGSSNGGSSNGIPRMGGANGARGGGMFGSPTPSKRLTRVLKTDADSYTWVLATTGATQGAGYQLATGRPVLAVGGFNGTDPSPTLKEFKALVRAGRIHYFLAGGGPGGGLPGGATGGPGGTTGGNTGGAPGGAQGGGPMQSGSTSAISAWVQANFTSRTVGGVTLYDLTSPTSGSSTTAASLPA